MNLIKEKLKLKNQIDQIQDEEFLLLLKNLLLYSEHKKFSTPLSLEEYNQKLEESEVAYSQGKVKKHKDLLKEVENWKQKAKK
jgi:hypothetical protein